LRRAKGYGLQIFCSAESTDDGGDIALVGVYFSIEVAHLGGRDLAGKIG